MRTITPPHIIDWRGVQHARTTSSDIERIEAAAGNGQAAHSALWLLTNLRRVIGYAATVAFDSWTELATLAHLAKSGVQRVVGVLAAAGLITVTQEGRTIQITMALPLEIQRPHRERSVQPTNDYVRPVNSLPLHDHDHDSLSPQHAQVSLSAPRSPEPESQPTATGQAITLPPRRQSATPFNAALYAHLRHTYPAVYDGLARRVCSAHLALTPAEFDALLAALPPSIHQPAVFAATRLASGADVAHIRTGVAPPARTAPTASTPPDYRALITNHPTAPAETKVLFLRGLDDNPRLHWPKVWATMLKHFPVPVGYEGGA